MLKTVFFSPCVASLDSCVTHSCVMHQYLKDRREKQEKKETVLQFRTDENTCTLNVNSYYIISFHMFPLHLLMKSHKVKQKPPETFDRG